MTDCEHNIVDMGYDKFSAKPELGEHLGAIVFRALARKPFKPLTVDLSTGRREMKSGVFLAAAIALSRRIAKIPVKRIGIVFPPGIACSLTNLAVVLADKTPVNLNFASGTKAVSICIRKAGLSHIITAQPVINKLPGFPWTDNTIDFAQLMGGIRKSEILGWLAAALGTPSNMLMRWLGIPTEGGEREAALLFSSGSTGEPKGIVLSHSNIISNCIQIDEVKMFRPETDIVMTNLPIFHSFGFTVNMWYPLVAVMKTVSLPNPLETRRIAQAIEDEKVSFLIGTPTLLRPYLKKVAPAQLRSLRLTVAGAEKPPAGFAQLWERTIGSRFAIGYGLTETSPAVAVDLDSVNSDKPSRFNENTGHLFPGMKARIVEDSTGEVIDPTSLGILELKGANVFGGYLDDAEATKRAFNGSWFRTGDIARFDEDGCLHIEGRISRFSKIAGEMVPHGTVEQAIVRALGLEDSEVPVVAVAGTSDKVKGESLVLLSAIDIDVALLREKLAAEGLPNLWIPRRIQRVDAIPTLASGKLDLMTLGEIAHKSADCEVESA
ncbi:MAG: AMP-binding protein [Opitutales bacterium]|nr:AMP-binding protein [Opitutales bacterium]